MKGFKVTQMENGLQMHIHEKTLTDGSQVAQLVITGPTGGYVTLDCVSFESAMRLRKSLIVETVEFKESLPSQAR